MKGRAARALAVLVVVSVFAAPAVAAPLRRATEPFAALARGGLPPPPQKAVLKTRYFGTVTVDHAAHLARGISCVRCHGPGPVSKLSLPPKVAHERCKGCHDDLQRGPVLCKGCHELAK